MQSLEEKQKIIEEEKIATEERLKCQEQTAKQLEHEKNQISDTALNLKANLEVTHWCFIHISECLYYLNQLHVTSYLCMHTCTEGVKDLIYQFVCLPFFGLFGF